MKKTIGILAHVDAGKTTFSEQLLYHAGIIRKAGRVDNSNTLLDSNTIDTPGHMDFSAEMERSLPILDYAIVLIGGMAGVQSHTVTLLRLLQKYHIPFFLFLNKEDMANFSLNTLMQDIKLRLDTMKLTSHLVFCDTNLPYAQLLAQMAEPVADVDEAFLECYLEESYSEQELETALISSIQKQALIPVCVGSALKDKGIKEFFHLFHKWTTTTYERHKKAMAEVLDLTPFPKVLSCFRQLEAEDPTLTVSIPEQGNGIYVNYSDLQKSELLASITTACQHKKCIDKSYTVSTSVRFRAFQPYHTYIF